jgi:AcrR family transcriptional regulator
MKPTAERVLDAAEDLFAEKGYEATSLGDVADKVGIRSPSLYNHFRNKEALYVAVMERLLEAFTAPLAELLNQPVTKGRVLDWLERLIYVHHENPNFARLVQHAALSGGPRTSELIDRMIQPMFQGAEGDAGEEMFHLGKPELQIWAVMALNNIVMSYITMAPMYQDILKIDLLSEDSVSKQRDMILRLARLVMGEAVEGPID